MKLFSLSSSTVYFVLCLLFIVISCKTITIQPRVPEVEVSIYSIDKLQLNLADKMKPQRIETSFQSLGVQYLCTLDPIENICVFAFDTQQKSLEEIINYLKNEVGVQSASKTKGCL